MYKNPKFRPMSHIKIELQVSIQLMKVKLPGIKKIVSLDICPAQLVAVINQLKIKFSNNHVKSEAILNCVFSIPVHYN